METPSGFKTDRAFRRIGMASVVRPWSARARASPVSTTPRRPWTAESAGSAAAKGSIVVRARTNQSRAEAGSPAWRRSDPELRDCLGQVEREHAVRRVIGGKSPSDLDRTTVVEHPLLHGPEIDELLTQVLEIDTQLDLVFLHAGRCLQGFLLLGNRPLEFSHRPRVVSRRIVEVAQEIAASPQLVVEPWLIRLGLDQFLQDLDRLPDRDQRTFSAWPASCWSSAISARLTASFSWKVFTDG